MPRDSSCVTLPGTPDFATTHWSVILTAADPRSSQARAAMAKLCQTYWYPIYAFIRREGHQPHDAQDLTQEFFTRLLEKNDLPSESHVRSRFRAFLLGSVRHFLANEWDKQRAQKRGGGKAFFDTASAESRYSREPATVATPEQIYERRWALTLLEQVLARLEAEYAACGKQPLFDQLKGALTATAPASYTALAARLNSTEGALKTAAHRLRKRYHEMLRAEISHTVTTPAEVDDELQHLMQALSAR